MVRRHIQSGLSLRKKRFKSNDWFSRFDIAVHKLWFLSIMYVDMAICNLCLAIDSKKKSKDNKTTEQ